MGALNWLGGAFVGSAFTSVILLATTGTATERRTPGGGEARVAAAERVAATNMELFGRSMDLSRKLAAENADLRDQNCRLKREIAAVGRSAEGSDYQYESGLLRQGLFTWIEYRRLLREVEFIPPQNLPIPAVMPTPA